MKETIRIIDIKETIKEATELLQEHADSIKDCSTYPNDREKWDLEESKADYEKHLSVIEKLKKL